MCHYYCVIIERECSMRENFLFFVDNILMTWENNFWKIESGTSVLSDKDLLYLCVKMKIYLINGRKRGD